MIRHDSPARFARMSTITIRPPRFVSVPINVHVHDSPHDSPAMKDAHVVSLALAKAKVGHLFVIYDQTDAVVCVFKNGIHQGDSPRIA